MTRFEVHTCADEAMFQRLLALNDGFLARAAKMSAEEWTARFRRCPEAFHCVLRLGGNQDEMAGYFVLLPVNEWCRDALREGTIAAGSQIQLSNLVQQGETPAAVYLSVVCASGPRAQKAAIDGVIAALRRLYSREVRLLFARAATATGARMLERLSGTRFEADGRIHTIDMADYDLIAAPR